MKPSDGRQRQDTLPVATRCDRVMCAVRESLRYAIPLTLHLLSDAELERLDKELDRRVAEALR